MIDAGGLAITQQWQHDRLSRLTTYIDPTGETTHYGYDSVGRLTSRTLPGGFTTLRSYDGNNRMVKEVQPSGAELHLTYDAAGRMAGMTSAAVVAPLQPIAAHKFRYDGLDRVTKAEAGAAVVERSYDSRGRLLSETMHGATISCRYDDAAGTVEKRWPDGRTELLRHDLGGRMVSVAQTANGMLGAGNGPLASFEPSGPGLLGRAVFRGGTTLSTSFDERRRLTEIALAGPAGLSGQVRYRYDAANRRRVEAIGGAMPKTSYFAFDARRRLLLARDGFAAAVPAATTQAQHDAAIAGVEAASAAATHTENYGYDAADARIAHTETGAPPNAYTYGPGHRLLNDGVQAYAHGADGALQAGGAFTYEADALGRIVAIRSGGALQLELTYDAFGRASALRPAGGAERAFHYLGGFVEQESIGGVPERQMTLQPASGVPIAWHSSAGTHFALVDARFNLLGLVDSNGALAETYRYQPFGAPQIFDAAGAPRATSAFGVRPLFGGQSWLADPGLYLSKMRLLHPALGQYLSPDPGGYADSPMLYAYAAQNPVDNIDPNGDIVFLLAALVIGGALVGAGYSIYDASEHPDKYAGLGGSLRVLGQVFGGAAIGGLAFVGGEVILGLGGTGAFATGAGVAGTGTGAASLTATQTFVLYGTSNAVSGGILRGGFNSMFPDYVDPITPGTVAFDFATGGGLATALGKLAPGVLDASHSAQNNWVNFATDQGGQAAISGQLGPYPGKIGQLLDKVGIRQGYSSTITNLDAGGTWYARTDTGVHEGFHALVARYFPTFRDLSHTARFWGAAARYPEEVVAYALGHSGALRFHGVPLAPLEAFNSLGRYSAGQQAFAKWFWGLTYAGLTGGALTKIALDKPGADEPAHPNVKPPGAK